MTGSELENKAIQKELQKHSLAQKFYSFFMQDLYDDADLAELYNSAGSIYLTEKKFDDATRCFLKSYNIYLNSKYHSHYAIKNLESAIQSYKLSTLCNYEQLISYLTIAANLYALKSDIGKHNEKYVEISEIYENNNLLDKSVAILDVCVDTNNLHYENITKLKIRLLITQQKFLNAAEICEIFVMSSVSRNVSILSKIDAREYAYIAILCLLAANDVFAANCKHEMFQKIIPDTFKMSIEENNSFQLINALEFQNIDQFQSVFKSLVKSSKPLHRTLFFAIESHISVKNEDGEEDLC